VESMGVKILFRYLCRFLIQLLLLTVAALPTKGKIMCSACDWPCNLSW
jgi:hypothetical protein